MLNIMIYDRGTKIRVFHVDDESKVRTDVTASYRLVDMVADAPEGGRFKGFFICERVSRAEERAKSSDGDILRRMRQ